MASLSPKVWAWVEDNEVKSAFPEDEDLAMAVGDDAVEYSLYCLMEPDNLAALQEFVDEHGWENS